MADMVLILGRTGNGKSTSIRTVKGSEMALLSCINKALPFQGWKKHFPNGHRVFPRSLKELYDLLVRLNKSPINKIVVDDLQFLMSSEFFNRINETGFNKFNDIGQTVFNILTFVSQTMKEDKTVIFMSHLDSDNMGNESIKTIGKVLDEKLIIESLFTTVLYAVNNGGNYVFQTKNSGFNTCKSPIGMFDSDEIPNDLNLVFETIKKYNEGE